MVTIIDYDIGNLRSMQKALEKVGVEVERTDDPARIEAAERLVLPGVGAFGACIAELRKRQLVDPIRRAVRQGTPFLGVCVGMQLLFETGEERGRHEGLGLLPGRVVRFDAEGGVFPSAPGNGASRRPLKIPHMGWNTVSSPRETPLLDGVDPAPYFYFVHSFHALPEEPDDVLGTTDYGGPFPSVVHRNNVFGVQFHPEKSQRNGLRILANFAQLPGRS